MARLGAESLAALGVGTVTLSGIFWIFNFLGISTAVNWNKLPYDQKINVGPSIPIPQKYDQYLKQLYAGDADLRFPDHSFATKS